MKFCEDHWEKLRMAIDDEGLSHLIAPSAKRAMQNTVNELEIQKRTIANFDPLMAAHWLIIARISEQAPDIMLIDGCPLCWVKETHKEECQGPPCTINDQWFEDWIPSVAKYVKGMWYEMKPKVGNT